MDMPRPGCGVSGLYFSGEVPLHPDIGPTFAAARLADAALKRVTLPLRICCRGLGLAEQFAEIEKVLVRSAALGEVGALPLGDEVLRRHLKCVRYAEGSRKTAWRDCTGVRAFSPHSGKRRAIDGLLNAFVEKKQLFPNFACGFGKKTVPPARATGIQIGGGPRAIVQRNELESDTIFQYTIRS